MDPNQDASQTQDGIGGWGQSKDQEPWSGLQDSAGPAELGAAATPPPPEPAPRRRRRRPSSLRTSAVDSSSAALGERLTSTHGSVSESEPTTSIINSPPVIGWMRAAGLAPPSEEGADAEHVGPEGSRWPATAPAAEAAPQPQPEPEPAAVPPRPSRGRRRKAAAEVGTTAEPGAVAGSAAAAEPTPEGEPSEVASPAPPIIPEAVPAPDWVAPSTALPTPEPSPVPPFVQTAADDYGDHAVEQTYPPEATGYESEPAYEPAPVDLPEPPAPETSYSFGRSSAGAEPAAAYGSPEPYESGTTYQPSSTVNYDRPGDPDDSEPSSSAKIPSLDGSTIDQSFDRFSEMATGSIKKLADSVTKRAGGAGSEAAVGSETVNGDAADGSGNSLPAPVGAVAKIVQERPELGVIATFAGGLILATLLKRLARR